MVCRTFCTDEGAVIYLIKIIHMLRYAIQIFFTRLGTVHVSLLLKFIADLTETIKFRFEIIVPCVDFVMLCSHLNSHQMTFLSTYTNKHI